VRVAAINGVGNGRLIIINIIQGNDIIGQSNLVLRENFTVHPSIIHRMGRKGKDHDVEQLGLR
jgi:hypothetical protein